jgi:hypothetical protein
MGDAKSAREQKGRVLRRQYRALKLRRMKKLKLMRELGRLFSYTMFHGSWHGPLYIVEEPSLDSFRDDKYRQLSSLQSSAVV